MPEEPDTMEPNTEEQRDYFQRLAAERGAKVIDLAGEIDRLQKELAKAKLSIDTLREGVNRVADATIPDHPQLGTLTILGKIHAIGEAYGGVKLACQDLHEIIAALRSQIVEWRIGGALGAELPTEDEGPYLFGSAHSFGYTRDLELLSQDWHLTDFYIPFAEIPLPLPQPPVTER